jgi:Ferritin-like domain
LALTTVKEPVPCRHAYASERHRGAHPKTHTTRHDVSKVTSLKRGAPAPELDTPTDLEDKAVAEISKALNALLADAFALYLKTKNFHWHISGPHFRDYHLMLDDMPTRFLPRPTRWPNAFASSAARRCARSVTSPRSRHCRTMTINLSVQMRCCAS